MITSYTVHFLFILVLIIHHINCYKTFPTSYKINNNIFKPLLVHVDSPKSPTFAASFIAQKNHILLDKLEHPENGNLTKTSMEYVNFCDESFDVFINERISALSKEEDKQALGRIRYEVNCARQRKLQTADNILREILSAGGLKQMEAKLNFYLKRFEIDMAFMVVLQLNIEDAREANSTVAVQVLTHLETMINEYQDQLASPPVKLLRMLLRENEPNVRKQMLRQRLLIGDNIENKKDKNSSDDITKANNANNRIDPKSTSSPQCEFIVVSPVQKWGGADVTVDELFATIDDILLQMSAPGGEEATISDMQYKFDTLKLEIHDVTCEYNRPKVNDRCNK